MPMKETWVQSLSQENPLEKEMATHSSITVWAIPWTVKTCRPQTMGLQESDRTEWLSNNSRLFIYSNIYIEILIQSPLKHSCLFTLLTSLTRYGSARSMNKIFRSIRYRVDLCSWKTIFLDKHIFSFGG